MSYLLDTNICIHMLNNKSFSLLKHAKKKTHTNIYISSITEAELWFGVFNSSKVSENTKTLKTFIQCFPHLPFTSKDASVYGELRAIQNDSGKLIGHNDLFLAAQAIENDLILVTNNEKEFKLIKNLRLENWLK
jgi:tRNA(fMet)-specific endonuclease VapC